MEGILYWVKSGLLFGIVASVILMLCPNKSYMKHIGMVVGLLFILVMLHPIMEFLNLDEKTYAEYVRNFLMMDMENDTVSDSNLELYKESMEAQLLAVFQGNGYPVKKIIINCDRKGTVCEIRLTVGENMGNIESVERYLKNLFGEDVKICYESG